MFQKWHLCKYGNNPFFYENFVKDCSKQECLFSFQFQFSGWDTLLFAQLFVVFLDLISLIIVLIPVQN